MQHVISIVVPCYNEESVIEETYTRLTRELSSLTYELIFVDDGSLDQTASILRLIAAKDPAVRVICFSRNFGHHVAVSAGIDHATGDAVVLIDADLQDPPALIPEMVKLWQQGYHVVYAVRSKRHGESLFKRITAAAFHRLIHRLADIRIPIDTGDFRLMDRKVVNVLKTMPEHHRYLRGMVAWAGFRQMGIPYERAERFAGETKYPLGKMIKFSLDGLTSFSYVPLRIATLLGTIALGISTTGLLVLLSAWMSGSPAAQGWVFQTLVFVFMGGVQLLVLAILGEYVGRIYDETRRRPLYIVQDRIGFDAGGSRGGTPEEEQG